MKIPLIWLKDYVDVDKTPREIADSFTRIGLMLDKPVGDDNVLDLEQRLNRSDLLSMIGCARDLAVFENVPLQNPKVKNHKAKTATAESKVGIKVECAAVNRFSTRVFRGIKVGPSPQWLVERLEHYGIDSINNIVDITNFVMTELGQTMHAQDTDKLPVQEIVIRNAKKGEKVTTLLGTEVALESPAFVLTSGNIIQVIGGIVGGKNSGVTESTTNIVLDAGNYDPRVVRTASRKLKIFNESVSHNDKPLDPRLTEIALDRATDLILELAGGVYYSNDDYYPHPVSPQTLSLSESRLQLISGQNISLVVAKKILKKLGYQITDESPEMLTVEVPYWRTDLEVEDDLISDVLRMRDYNTIPFASLSTPIPHDITPALYKFEDKLRDHMVALGSHEHITTQLVQDDGNPDRIVLENALSEEQKALRMSALETLPTVVETYRKHGIEKPILFEIGKSFLQKDYRELRELAIIDQTDIRATVATLLQALGLPHYQLIDNKGKTEIKTGKAIVGQITTETAVFDIPQLLTVSSPYPVIRSEYSHTKELDLSISYDKDMKFSEISRILHQVKPQPTRIEVVDEYDKWKLVRLTWDSEIKDLNILRQKLVESLKTENIETRSG